MVLLPLAQGRGAMILCHDDSVRLDTDTKGTAEGLVDFTTG